MTIDLQATLADVESTVTRKRSVIITRDRPAEHWSGADLVRAIDRAIGRHRSARRLPDSEREAVAQETAVRVLSAKGLERVAGDYLSRAVSSVLDKSRTWQDTADRYLTARERQADTGPMIVPVADPADPAVGGNLAASVVAASPDVAPADVPDLARIVAARLLDNPADVVSHRRLTARLVQAMAVSAGDDPALALADLAVGDGRTLNAWSIDATRGAAVLAGLDTEPTDLLRVIRDAARDAGLGRSAVWDRIDLDGATRCAGEAVAVLARSGGSWDPASIGTDRSMPDVRDRGPIIDAAPFPGLRRPDPAAPSSPIGRGPTVRYGRPMEPTPSPVLPPADRPPNPCAGETCGCHGRRSLAANVRPDREPSRMGPSPARWQPSGIVGARSPRWDARTLRWQGTGALATADL